MAKPLAAQVGLQVADTLSDQELVQMLVGGGLQISNIVVNCADTAYGSFDGTNCNIGIDSGLILTTGNIDLAKGPNDDGSVGIDNFRAGDPMLTNLAGALTQDACVVEFDLVPNADTLKFRYVFGSEEYLEFVSAGFNDVFGFFITGPGIPGVKNLAVIPGTATPVSIDNVNDVTNSAYYVDNGDGATAPYNQSAYYIQYDGFTTVLEATQVVQPCQTYRLRLAVADVGDGIYDSGVFIEAESLVSAGVRITVGSSAGGGFPFAIEGCTDGQFTFTRPIVTGQPDTVHFVIGGTSTNGVDYPWTADSIIIPAGQASATLTITPIVDGLPEGMEHMVIYLFDPCFGGYLDSAVLFFLDEMQVQVSPDTTICQGDSVAIWATGGTVYSWAPPSFVTNSAASDPFAFPLTTTTYTVQVTAGACTETATLTVNVDPAPPLDAGIDVAICIGESEQMMATGAVTYSWDPPTGLSDPTIAEPIATPSSTTTYIVTGTGTNGCTAKDQVTVTVSPLPNVSAYPDTIVCQGHGVTLQATGGVQFAWQPTTGLDNPASGSPMALPSSDVTYTVTATDANGCSDDAQLSLTVIPSPFVDAGRDTSILLGQSLQLSGVTDGVGFEWSPLIYLTGVETLGPVAAPERTTTYYLTATADNGCTTTDSVVVAVAEGAVIAVPNAFTPNGDNINDYLWIRSLGIINIVSFRILNRWGQVVFATNTNDILDNEYAGWDGLHHGQPQPMGVYAYVFKGVMPSGKEIIQSGNITLLR